MSYIYAGHMGGLYTSTYEIDYDQLYCEQCGDSDQLVAEVNTVGDLLSAIYQLKTFFDYDTNYIAEFIKEDFDETGIILPRNNCLPVRDWEYTGRDQCPIYCNFFEQDCDLYGSLDDPDAECDWCHKNFEYELYELNQKLDLNAELN